MCADVVGDEKLVYFLTQRFANIVCTGTLHDRCTSLAHQDTSLHPALKTFWPLVLERLISAGLALEAHPDVLDKLDQLPFDTALSLSRDVLHGKFKAEDSREEAEETARAAGVEDSTGGEEAMSGGAGGSLGQASHMRALGARLLVRLLRSGVELLMQEELQKEPGHHQAVLPVLQKVTTMLELQAIMRNPMDFFQAVVKCEGNAATKLVLASVRATFEQQLLQNGVEWSDIQALFERLLAQDI